jgi:hypothetical protein
VFTCSETPSCKVHGPGLGDGYSGVLRRLYASPRAVTATGPYSRGRPDLAPVCDGDDARNVVVKDLPLSCNYITVLVVT